MPPFRIVSDFRPTGDQPQAVDKLVAGLEAGLQKQALLGVTGSGKTFTMANIIERVQRPTLVMCHNKTLAAQLCTEFKEFFPDNAVEYFTSEIARMTNHDPYNVDRYLRDFERVYDMARDGASLNKICFLTGLSPS